MAVAFRERVEKVLKNEREQEVEEKSSNVNTVLESLNFFGKLRIGEDEELAKRQVYLKDNETNSGVGFDLPDDTLGNYHMAAQRRGSTVSQSSALHLFEDNRRQ